MNIDHVYYNPKLDELIIYHEDDNGKSMSQATAATLPGKKIMKHGPESAGFVYIGEFEDTSRWSPYGKKCMACFDTGMIKNVLTNETTICTCEGSAE